MDYKAVFWKIDGIIYDNTKPIPQLERELLLSADLEQRIKSSDLPKLEFFVPYPGMKDLMEEIPGRQGVLALGHRNIQVTKLKLLGVYDFIDPELIVTSAEEAEKIVDTPGHHYLGGIERLKRADQLKIVSKNIAPVNTYLFREGVQRTGYKSGESVNIGGRLETIGAYRQKMKTIYVPEAVGFGRGDPLSESNVIPGFTVQPGDVDTLKTILL